MTKLSFTRAELVDLTRKEHYDRSQLSEEDLMAVDSFVIGNILRARRDLARVMSEDPGNTRHAMLDSMLDLRLQFHPRILQYQDLP
jgi:hypothetical protein